VSSDTFDATNHHESPSLLSSYIPFTKGGGIRTAQETPLKQPKFQY